MGSSRVSGRAPSNRRVKRPRLSEIVADQIQQGLIAGGMRPGEKLPTEGALEAEYGVSRAVVREAGRLLVERGLVEIGPGRGMVVAEPDGAALSRQFALLLELGHSSFQDLMEMRLVLEVGLTEYAASRHTPSDDRAIRAALDRFARPGLGQAAALAADLEFHRAIAAASQNPFFVHIVDPINAYLRRVYKASLGYEAARSRTLAEHKSIADAVVAGDAEAAGAYARQHLTRILNSADQLVAGAV